MAIIKISDLNNLVGLDSADIFPLVDLSADETKKITAKNLFSAISTIVGTEAFSDSSSVIGIVTTLVDSDYVQARVTLDGVGIDSATASSIADGRITTLVDSDYVQARVTLDGTGLDSAGVIDVLENTSVAGGVLTTFNTTSAVMGFGAVNIDNRLDGVPVDTTAFGAEALRGLGSGQANTGFGHTVLSGVTTGSNNTAVGADAMGNVTTSTSNSTAIGQLAGYSSIGNSNVFVGMQAGQANGTSKESVYIGYRAAQNQSSGGADGTNNIVIGANASKSDGSVNNEITLGNTSITRFRIPGLGYEVFDSAGSLIFELNGTRVMRLDASGNLAIAGTVSESQTL